MQHIINSTQYTIFFFLKTWWGMCMRFPHRSLQIVSQIWRLMLLSGSKVYQVLLISPLRANNVLAAVVPFRTDKL